MGHYARITLDLEPNAQYQSVRTVYGYEATVKYVNCPDTRSAISEEGAIAQLLDAIAQTYVQNNNDLGEPLFVVSPIFAISIDPATVQVSSFGVTVPSPNATMDTWLHEFAFALECVVKNRVQKSDGRASVHRRGLT